MLSEEPDSASIAWIVEHSMLEGGLREELPLTGPMISPAFPDVEWGVGEASFGPGDRPRFSS